MSNKKLACDQISMTHELFYLLRDQILMTREQTLITQFAFYLVHEVTNLSDYAPALSGHKVAPSGFAYFCPRNRKGVSVSLRK